MLRVSLAPIASLALLAATALAQAPPGSAGPRAPVAPLFASDEVLTFTIEAPLTTIFKDRGDERREQEAKVILPGSDGRNVTVGVDVRTRGKSRAARAICEFPPLRLDFDNAKHGTVFDRQNDLKLVTHCQDKRSEYDQYVLQEYLVYRMYGLLTEQSFKVRLARVTYIDTEGKRDAVTRHGFLIEPVEDMAERNGWQALELPAVPPQLVDPRSVALVALFQYLIGNPDWSLFTIEPDEKACCHNTVPIGAESGPIFSVAYDFDVSGIVNTRYADRLFAPETRDMGIRRVRERAYRGFCASASHLPELFALFNQKREAIYATYRTQPGLDPEVVKETVEYLDAFYDTINDPKKVERELSRKCVE